MGAVIISLMAYGGESFNGDHLQTLPYELGITVIIIPVLTVFYLRSAQ